MERRKAKNRSKKGFTLVELVVVIAVLAILAGVGTVAYRGYITKANEAHDLALLSAVNTAFQSAYTEKELSTYPKTAVATLEGSEGKLKLTDLSATDESGAERISGFYDVFKKYFKGNEDALFKVYTGLKYGIEPGVFSGILPKGEMALNNGMKIKSVDNGTTTTFTVTDGSGKQYTYTLQDDDMETFNGSTFGKNMEMSSLMGEVDNVVQALKGVVGDSNIESLKEMIGGDEYLKTLGVTKENYPDDDAYKEAVTNAVVMHVAEASAGLTANDVINNTEKWKNCTERSLLASMATVYGSATAYANSDMAKDSNIVVGDKTMTVQQYYKQQSEALRNIKNPSDSMGIIFGMLGNMEKSEKWKDYQSSEDYENDLNGYFSALNALAGNKDTLVSQGAMGSGFSDEDLGAILDAMFE